VNVIGHYDDCMQIEFGLVIVATTTKNDVASIVRENPVILGDKRDEVRLVVSL
jgi:hypothetical protein